MGQAAPEIHPPNSGSCKVIPPIPNHPWGHIITCDYLVDLTCSSIWTRLLLRPFPVALPLFPPRIGFAPALSSSRMEVSSSKALGMLKICADRLERWPDARGPPEALAWRRAPARTARTVSRWECGRSHEIITGPVRKTWPRPKPNTRQMRTTHTAVTSGTTLKPGVQPITWQLCRDDLIHAKGILQVG